MSKHASKPIADPAHSAKNSKNTGTHDFSGQEGHDDPRGESTESEAREGIDGQRINFSKQHNEHNGSSTRCKIIHSSSHELHGGRRSTTDEGGVP